MIKKKVLLLLLLLGVLNSKAQVHSVDPFTGTGSVNIPLYDYSIDGLSLGVSVGYSCTGIKVDQVASNVGLGWNLNAGGSIVRESYGVDDDEYFEANSERLFPYGLWGSMNGAWPAQNSEYEPDCFTASFGGRTLKFFICPSTNQSAPPKMQVYTYPKSNVQIDIVYKDAVITTCLPDSIANDFDGVPVDSGFTFRIIDEKGNKFEFEAGSYREKYESTNHVTYSIERWDLKKVTTYTGAEINYEYNRFNTNGHIESFSQTVTEVRPNSVTDDFGVTSVTDSPSYYRGRFSQIKNIYYPNGTIVEFGRFNDMYRPDCNQDSNAISFVHIYHKYGGTTPVEETFFDFNYSLFNTPITDIVGVPTIFTNIDIPVGPQSYYQGLLTAIGVDTAESYKRVALGTRLKLNSISKATTYSTERPYYTFYYNLTPLPLRSSGRKDWYGYYNNKSISPLTHSSIVFNNLSIPYHQIKDNAGNVYSYGIDKSADIDYMKACVLEKIKNEIGGEVEFVYKPHSLVFSGAGASRSDKEGHTGYDGLCIDKIIMRDGYNLDHTKTVSYSYSGGKKMNVATYCWLGNSFFNTVMDYSNNQAPYTVTTYIPGAQVKGRLYNNSFLTPLNIARGSSHGYSDVVIEERGFNNELLNKTAYHFSNVDDAGTSYTIDDKTPEYSHTFMPTHFNSDDIGMLLNEKTYANSSSPVNEKVYTYITRTSSLTNFTSHEYKIFGIDAAFNHYQLLPLTGKFLSQVTETSYTNGQSISKATQYTYNSNQDKDYVKTITTTDSKGDSYQSEFLYNFDYTFSVPDPLGTKEHLLTTRNWKINVGSNNELLSTQTVHPQMYGTRLLCPTTFNTYLNDAPSTTDEHTAIIANNSTSGLHKSLETTVYDSKFNPVEQSIEEGKRYISSIWDSRIGQKTADVVNAKYNRIAFTSFEGYGGYQELNVADDNKGHWNFEPDNVTVAGTSFIALSGKNYYLLSPSGTTNNDIVSTITLENSKDYLLTFWARSSGVHVFRGIYEITTIQAYNTTATGWTLYGVKITGNGTNVSLKSTGSSIEVDEVRLHPIEASMTTYSFNPLSGVNTLCDGRNNVVYTNKLPGDKTVTRDIDGNILSLTHDVVQGDNN